MRVELMFPSKYLKEADLQGRKVRVTIAKVQIDELQMTGGHKEKKPVVYLKGKEKMLVLNKTNALAIASMYGMDTDAWVDKAIVLRPAQDRFQGKMVACIRIDVDGANVGQAKGEDPREPGADG